MTVEDIAQSVLADPTVHRLLQMITSDPARKGYLLIGLIAMLAYAMRRAQNLDSIIKTFGCRLQAADEYELRKPGPKPSRIEGLEKRIQAVEAAIEPVKSELSGDLRRYVS